MKTTFHFRFLSKILALSLSISNKRFTSIIFVLLITHFQLVKAQLSFSSRDILGGTGGFRPTSIAVDDFNGDAEPDLVIANYINNNVSVLIGLGKGNFGSIIHYSVGSGPRSVVIGDYNSDGKPDLAVANSGSNNVSILTGTGTGSFGMAVNYNVGSIPYCVAEGDFNGDGKSDLAVANAGSNSVSILTGTGAGSFGMAINYNVGSTPYFLIVGDFNKDNKPDLAVANSGANTISVLIGTGIGGFEVAVNYSVGSGPRNIALGDFNDDSNLDLVVANSNSNNVSILTSTGMGSFGMAVNYNVGSVPYYISVGDFNNDSRLDLAVANFGENSLSILTGTGTGSFSGLVSYNVGSNPCSISMGDFNGDSKSDLAVANHVSNNVSILTGTGVGSFGTSVNFSLVSRPHSVATGDFNEDGKADLAVANSFINNVSIFTGTGTGDFGVAVNYNVGIEPFYVVVGDFNGDGKADLVVANYASNNISVLTGTGKGSFGVSLNYNVGSNPRHLAVGDFNMDGKLDLVVANSGSNSLSVLTNTGSGNFGEAANYNVGTYPIGIDISDFNGDGKPDLAVANHLSNDIYVLINAGAGSFGSMNVFSVGANPQSLTVGDFNGDRKADLVVANSGSNNVCILTGTGLGSFGDAVYYNVGTNPRSITVNDFNGDGKTDLAVANFSSNNVSILTGTGTGSFGTSINYKVGSSPLSIITGDFNGDNKSDLSVVNTSDIAKSVSILLNNTSTPFAQNIINFTVLNQLYGNRFTFNATATSGLPVSYSSSNTSILSISNNTVTATGIGVVTITAFQNGNTTFEGVTLSGTLTVAARPLTVRGFNYSITYGEQLPSYSGTILGIVNGDVFNFGASCAATSLSGVGTYSIKVTATGVNINNYELIINNSTLSISPTSATVLGFNTKKGFGEPNPSFTGTVLGIKNNDSVVFSASTTATQSSNVGVYPIQVTVSGSRISNYVFNFQNAVLTITENSMLVAHYPFNGNANDESGNNHNGTIVGNLFYGTDRHGNPNSAIVFDNSTTTSKFVEVAHSPDLNFSSSFSLSVWFKLERTLGSEINEKRAQLISKGRDVIDSYNFTLDNGIMANTTTNPGTTFSFTNNYPSTPNNWGEINFITPFKTTGLDQKWTHAVAVVNNDEKTMKLYINGILNGVQTISSVKIQNTESLLFGQHSFDQSYGYPFVGLLDDISIYRKALREVEIISLYSQNCPNTIFTPTIGRTGNNISINNTQVNISYQWYKNNELEIGQNSASHTAVLETAIYKVKAYNECASVFSDERCVKVNKEEVQATIIEIITTSGSCVTATNGEANTDFILYPNPTNGAIYILNKINSPISKIEIYSLQGENMLTFENTNFLDLGSLSRGFYILKVYANEAKHQYLKVLKE